MQKARETLLETAAWTEAELEKDHVVAPAFLSMEELVAECKHRGLPTAKKNREELLALLAAASLNEAQTAGS